MEIFKHLVKLFILTTSIILSKSYADQTEYKFSKSTIEKLNLVSLEGKVQWHVDGLSRCCTLCCDDDCYGVFYQRNRGLCVKSDNISEQGIPVEEGWIFYSRTSLSHTQIEVEPIKLYAYIPSSTTNLYSYTTDECFKDGRHLVQIGDQEKHDLIINFIDAYLMSTGTTAPNELYILIDGRLGNDSTWYFINGEEMSYLNWAQNQPNNYKWSTRGNQTVMTLKYKERYKMNDYWMAQYDPDVIWFLCEV